MNSEHRFYFTPVNTDYQGHVSFHDEAIKARKSGFYYRAPVAHEWHFDNVGLEVVHDLV